MKSVNVLTIIFFTVFLSNCSGQVKNDNLRSVDKDAMGLSHGYNYTPFGLLLNAPWMYNSDEENYRVLYRTSNDSVISELKLSANQKNLVFELQKNGSVKYWFKKDYLISPDDTVIRENGVKGFNHKVLSSREIKVKKIYIDGKWKVDFDKNCLIIGFGKNDYKLNSVNVIIGSLNNDELQVNEIMTTAGRKIVNHFSFVH